MTQQLPYHIMKYKDGKISLHTRTDTHEFALGLGNIYFLRTLNADALFVVDTRTNTIIGLTTESNPFYIIRQPREAIYDMLAQTYTIDRFVKRIYD